MGDKKVPCPSFAHAFTGTKKKDLPDLPLVKMWTDGSHSPQKKIGGWAFIMEYAGRQVMLSGSQPCGDVNPMELMAFTQACEHLKVPCRIELVSDSSYLVSGLTKWMANWKRIGWMRKPKTKKARERLGNVKQSIPNRDVWEYIWRLCERHQVFAKWVKGHHPLSPRQHHQCDRMARLAWEGLKAGTITPLAGVPREPDIIGWP